MMAKAVSRVRDYLVRERHRFDDASVAVTEEFLSWVPSLTGCVLQTAYCHADVPRGRKYDMVFDVDSPDDNQSTLAVIHYNVIWGNIVSAGLVDGWHQAVYVEFPEGLPKLVASLAIDDFKLWPQIGICDA